MTTFTDVFGSDTLPPAEYGYRALTLTTDTTLLWPYNTNDATVAVAKILDVSCAPGNVLTTPDARSVSTGEDFLIRNVGAQAITLAHPSGATLATIAAGKAVYFYLTDNTTEDGVYGQVDYGVGTSQVDAATLIGYGIKAIGATLNQSHPVTTISSATTIDASYRAKLVVNIGGAVTVNLASVVTLGDDYFFCLRNSGTGTLTIDPEGATTIDGQGTLTLQPGESLLLFCSGASWYSVGYGRSTIYQFTQLVKDVSAGGSFTLSATEAGNKLITFAGNPASGVTIIVPNVVSVYYLSSVLSTAQTVTVKTAAGSGVVLPQGARVIAICDGANVFGAQSVSASTSVSLIDGSVANPSLNFASQTNTGLYKSGANGLGIAVNGASVLTSDANGVSLGLTPAAPTAAPGTNTTQIATTAGIVAERAAVAALTNKTIASATNNVEARSLKSATTVVDVSTAPAPTAGQVLTASSGTAAVWASPAAATQLIPRSTRTSNTILGAGDKGTLVDITSGTFTQTLTAAATLGAGWFAYIKNSGTGVITLDPNGAETIDGKTTINMYQGEAFILECDGANFNTIGRQSEWTLPEVVVAAATANITVSAPFSDTEVSEIRMSGVLEVGTNGANIGFTAGAWVGNSYYGIRSVDITSNTVTQFAAQALAQLTGSMANGELDQFDITFSGIRKTGLFDACLVANFAGASQCSKTSVSNGTAAKPTSMVLTPSTGTFADGLYQLTLRRA